MIILCLGLSYGIGYVVTHYFLDKSEILSRNPTNSMKNVFGQKDGKSGFGEQDKRGFDKVMSPEERMISLKKRLTFSTVYLVFFTFLIGSIIKITQEWYNTEKQKKEMENAKLMSELSSLKSQVNPHFLFNTLNGIYALAIKKSDETPKAVIKLSELMRHMLFESEKDQIVLDKEIEYLENFVELQKLRLPLDAKVSFLSKGKTSGKMIEPMLFIPFVENAFKHGQDIQGVDITIELNVDGDDLSLKVANKISSSNSKDESSGIGLVNIRKRLDLLYQDAYKIKHWELNGFYFINLVLKLSKA